jgi:Iron/zinc purple acid phosphatase-like protein C
MIYKVTPTMYAMYLATVQMVVGTGGAGFTKTAESPGPDWNELFFYQWGYARVTALNSSYLNWEWVNSTTGIVIDHMMIYQDDATQPWVTSANNDDDTTRWR